jgi:hypothetical protein
VKGLCGLVLALAAGLPAFAAHADELTDISAVYPALEAGRYDDVEAFYAKLRKSRKRNPNGTFQFERFYESVYWYSSTDPKDPSYWPKVDAATKAWVVHSPKSHLAAMTRAFALSYRGEAVEARGGAWKEVDLLAGEARRLIGGSKQQGASDALWHATRLRVAAVSGAPRADVLDMIHAAVAVDPQPVRLWQEAAIALSPDGRKAQDLAWLMRLAGQRTAKQEGKSMEARVFQSVFWHYTDIKASPFGGTGLDWSELHQSFLDWKARYPAGYDRNLHGALACAAHDRDTTASLLAQIGNEPSNGTWELLGGKDYAARCKEWATSTARTPRT